jgi:hypothetical protein
MFPFDDFLLSAGGGEERESTSSPCLKENIVGAGEGGALMEV